MKEIPHCLKIDNLFVSYHGNTVLEDVSIVVPSGKLCAIIGPNGAGKSTLMKTALDLIPENEGEVLFFNSSYRSQRKKIAYLPQRGTIDWDFPATVTDVVTMGLYSEKGLFKRITALDKQKVKEAIVKVDLKGFSNRQISELSGGQQQRVFIARALVQEPQLFMMDEPFAGVDVTSELSILNILKELVSEGKSILVVHHDLDTVNEYFNHAILLNKKVIAQGTTSDVITHHNLKTAFGNLMPEF